jgi:hypothetical protein
MRRFARILIAVAGIHLAASAAFADISLRLSNQELTNSSQAIVVGRAVDRSVRWIDGTLVTAVGVEISDSLKGSLSGRIEVLLPGGVDANRRIKVGMTFPGAPQIQPNEDVFLFLTFDEDVSGYIVGGFAQGKFSIVTQQGRRMISRDLSGSQLVEGTGIARGTRTLTPFDDFRSEIASYIGR